MHTNAHRPPRLALAATWLAQPSGRTAVSCGCQRRRIQPVLRLRRLVAAGLLTAVPAAWAGGVQFDLQRLPVGSAGQQQFLTGLNANGVVVGFESARFTPATAFKIEGGSLTLFPKPAGTISQPAGIADNGLIVGFANGAGTGQAGYLGATFTPINALSLGVGDESAAAAIDPAGLSVVGRTFFNGATRSWINSAGRVVEVPLMVEPAAINNAGQVAGNLSVAHRPVAALYTGGTTVSLGTLGGAGSWVTGMNASGTVIGESELAGTGTAGFIFDGNGLRATRPAAGYDSFMPLGINDAGQIVGDGHNNTSGNSAQLAVGAGAPVDLNPRLSAQASDSLAYAQFINASGQIAGRCVSGYLCLLTPTGTLAWASTTGGSFDDARHWDSGLGFAPNRHLDVLIAPAAAVTVLARQGAEFKSLVVGTATVGASQATLQLAEGARLVGTAATTRIERSGILMGDGVVAGGLVNRGTLQGTAAVPLHITVEGTLDNQGLITGSGRINANLINRGSSPGVRVGAGELLTIGGTAHSGADGSVLEVRNGGELRIEGTYTAQAGSFIRLDNATLRVTGLLNAGTVQIGFGGASIFGDVVNSLGSSSGRIIASGGSETTFWGRVANHNEVRAAAGAHIVYFGDVSGAGSFTAQGAGAYHRFEAAYNPGDAATAAAVVDLGSAEFNGLLALDLAGAQAGSGFDQLRFGAGVLFDAASQLSLNLRAGFSPQAGQRFQLFQYTQAPDGQFGALDLPTLAAGLAWDTADLYAGGSLGVSAVPEPASAWLLLVGGASLLRRTRGRRAGPADAKACH